MSMRRKAGDERGFALLIVLWTMGFLAVLGSRIVTAGRSDTRLTDNLKQQAVLQSAADGAIADVMFSLLAARDPHIQPDGLVRTIRIGQILVQARIENESDRINLNRASPALLRALIVGAGGSPAVAEQLAGAIVAWRDVGVGTGQRVAQVPQYRAAGRSYGPPGTPFESLDELADVVGMTPALFARLAPHLTVLTRNDPDGSTRDPVVARALADSAGVADLGGERQAVDDDAVLRISVTATGPGNARYVAVVVASADFQTPAPRIDILMRTLISQDTAVVMAVGS